MGEIVDATWRAVAYCLHPLALLWALLPLALVAGAVFGLGTAPWGGHPSSNLQDIQSGLGWVHNTFLLEGIEKMVLRAPAKAFPVSPWFPGHKTQDVLGRRLVDFEMGPSWLKIPGIAVAGMKA